MTLPSSTRLGLNEMVPRTASLLCSRNLASDGARRPRMRSIGRWSPNARRLGMSGGILLWTVVGNDCGDNGAKKSDSIQNRDDGAMTELLLGAVEFRKWSRNARVSFQLVANRCTCVE